MKDNKKFIAIIPAREGSKGIKDKNIIDLNGKPLIAYSIESALNSKYIDTVVVSTDGEKIAKIAQIYGAKVPFMRPKSLASDESKTIDVVIHCLDEMKKLGYEYDYMVLLQPTQPLRQVFHIDESIELILERKEEQLVSVSEVKEHPILIRTIDENGYGKSLLNINSTKRRQEYSKYYKVNGAIYINKIDENLNSNTSLNDNKLIYEMEKKYDVDIDEMLDLQIAKFLLDKENKRFQYK